MELLKKLYLCSGEPRLAPELPSLERLIKAKDLDTQVAIEQAHHRPVLVNEQGLCLEPEEQRLLRAVGDEVKRRWYGAASGLTSESYGRKGAGYLAHKSLGQLNQGMNGLEWRSQSEKRMI